MTQSTVLSQWTLDAATRRCEVIGRTPSAQECPTPTWSWELQGWWWRGAGVWSGSNMKEVARAERIAIGTWHMQQKCDATSTVQ